MILNKKYISNKKSLIVGLAGGQGAGDPHYLIKIFQTY